jgi:PAS domain-containing protein
MKSDGYLKKMMETIEEESRRIEMVVQRSAVSDAHKVTGELSVAMEELRVTIEELHYRSDQLTAARRSLAEVMDFIPDAYFLTDPYGVIREANDAASRMLQPDGSGLVGKPLSGFIAEAHRAEFQSLLGTLAPAREVTRWQGGLQLRGRGGIEALFTVKAVRDGKGRPTALRWLVRTVGNRGHA